MSGGAITIANTIYQCHRYVNSREQVPFTMAGWARRSRAGKGLSATEIRQKMMNGEPWEDLVPPAVARLLKKFAVQDRLQETTVPDGKQKT